jgi:hypothetical protein
MPWETRVRYTRWRKRPVLQIQICIPVLVDGWSNETRDLCYWRDATLVDLHQMITWQSEHKGK